MVPLTTTTLFDYSGLPLINLALTHSSTNMTVLSKTLTSTLNVAKMFLALKEGKVGSMSKVSDYRTVAALRGAHPSVEEKQPWRGCKRYREKPVQEEHSTKGRMGVKQKSQGLVNMLFFKNLWKLLKCAIPSWKDAITIDLTLLTGFLVVRTFLSIYISQVNGNIVKNIVKYDMKGFLGELVKLGMLALPASFVNSFIDFETKILALKFRKNMTYHFHSLYIKDLIYYQLTNIDSRIGNPDQRLTQDIEKWSVSLANLYINFAKPLLDLVLFSRKLAQHLSWKGPAYAMLSYFMSSLVLRYLSPAFGRMRATEQILEGEHRKSHTDLIYWSEEIAFQKGAEWEKKRINKIYNKLYCHIKEIIDQKLWMGTFDSMFVKYGATLCGYGVLSIPVFGAGSQEYLERMKKDPSSITRDYIRNSSLLINMSKAIGRIAISYKELQNLAGYSHLINEMDDVLLDLEKGNYVRNTVVSGSGTENLNMLSRGKFVEAKCIKFDAVPIVSPNGDVLVENMNFEVAES